MRRRWVIFLVGRLGRECFGRSFRRGRRRRKRPRGLVSRFVVYLFFCFPGLTFFSLATAFIRHEGELQGRLVALG